MLRLNQFSIVSACLSIFICNAAFAVDARTAALGGSAIAHGKGVHGALENPSSLMQMNRKGEKLHFHLGASADVRDNARIFETAIDEKDLLTEIESQLDSLSGSSLFCTANSESDAICLDNIDGLSELSTRVLDIFERFDKQPFKARLTTDVGAAYTKSAIPFAVHLNVSATAAATTVIADEDKDYLNTFAEVLEDSKITYEELISSVPLTLSSDGASIRVLQPEEALQSAIESSALLRVQLGLSAAFSRSIADHPIDFGITPKISKLTASSLTTQINEHFDDESDSLQTQFKSNEAIANTWNVDLGATMSSNDRPITFSAVARNLRKESITTNEGFVFETTPQLIIGGALHLDKATITADMALNNAKVDNLDTQIMAVGIETQRRFFALRAGFSHDNARRKDASALSLGFSVGPLHIGGRVTNQNAAQAGAQLAFSF